jgi:hypothetical protein
MKQVAYKEIYLKVFTLLFFVNLGCVLQSQNIINWQTININNTLYTLKVDANVLQLDQNNDLFYSGNRSHTNSFFLVNNSGLRIDDSQIEQKAIYTCESFFNLSHALDWPGECNFQIDPIDLTYYTGTDNQNNIVNLYFPSAFDESYFNSHVWLGATGLEGLHNYIRRKNCYRTMWEACLMPEVSLLMNMDDVEKEIFEQWGNQVIKIFGEQPNISQQSLLTGLIEFRDELNLEAQLASDVKLLKFGSEVDHLMSLISTQASTLALSTNALLGILTYNFTRAYSAQRIAAVEMIFNNLSPSDYDMAMYQGFLMAKSNVESTAYTTLDLILNAFLGSPELRLANTFQDAISKTQDLIKGMVQQHLIAPSITTGVVYLSLELLDEMAWLYEGETMFEYVALNATIQKFVGLYISTHLNTNDYNTMNNLLSLYDIMTFSSLNYYNYQKQRMTQSPPNWLVGALNLCQVWFSSSGIQGYQDYMAYLDYWIHYYLYGTTKRYFFVKNPVNMLSKNHKIYLQENIYPFLQGSDQILGCTNQRSFSLIYRNSANLAPNIINLNLNNQLISLSNTNSNFSEGVVFSGTGTLNSGQNNYNFLSNNNITYPSNSVKTFYYPYTGYITVNGNQSTLSNGNVNPQEGNTSTNFQFSVTFSDALAPQYVKVIGIDWSQTMSTTGTTFCSGVNFTTSKTFNTIGTNQYYYEAKTSNNTILRYPATGYLTFVVNALPTQGVTLTVSPNPATVNQQVTLTAQLNPVQGNYLVDFYADPNNVGNFSPSNGQAYTNASGVATISYYPTATGNIDLIAVDGLNSAKYDLKTLHVQPPQTNISIIVSHNRIGVTNNKVEYDINIRVYNNGSPYYNYTVTFGTDFGIWGNGLQTHTFYSQGSYILSDPLYATQNGFANITVTVEGTTVNYPLQIQYTIPAMTPVSTMNVSGAESVSFLPGDDKFAYNCSDHKVYIYDVSDRQNAANFTFYYPTNSVTTPLIVRYNLDGTKMFVGSQNGSRIVNSTIGTSLGQSLAANSSLQFNPGNDFGDACWASSSSLLVCSEQPSYTYNNGVFSASGLAPSKQLFAPDYYITELSSKSNKTTASVYEAPSSVTEGFTRLFNPAFDALYSFNPPGNGWHYGCAVSPDGSKTILSDDYDGILYQYNNSTYGQINSFASGSYGRRMAWNPVSTNYLACVHDDGKLIIWNVASGTQYMSATGIPDYSDVCWSGDGQILVTAGNGVIHIFAPFDQNAPFLHIESPGAGFSTIQSTITLSGYITDDSQVTSADYRVNSETWTSLILNSAGQFSTTINLIIGSNAIDVRGYDRFGKVTVSSVTGTRLSNQISPSILVQPSNIICSAGANVSFTVAATGTAPLNYQWKVDGNNIGSNNNTLTLNWISYSNIGNYSCLVSNLYGSASSNNASLSIGTPTLNIIQNTTVTNGTTTCFDALQTITIAGNGNTFTVQSGANVHLIAGHNIDFLPGSVVQLGGNLHAYISTDGTYCNNIKNSPAISSDDEIQQTEIQPTVQRDGLFKIFPNPTNGKFTLELTGDKVDTLTSIRIYNMYGGIVQRYSNFTGKKMEFSLENNKPGIYLINFMHDGKAQNAKVIKIN